MSPQRRRQVALAAGPLLGLFVASLLGGLPSAQRIMAGVFVFAVHWWITEPVPLYVTGVVTAFASALLLGPLGPSFGAPALDYRLFLTPFASPVVVLMFGGFVMARVFSRQNLDLEFSRFCLARFGLRPRRVLLGVMLLTAGMSMWMSNTATTAIMVASLLPLVRGLPRESPLARAFLLGIPFAANIGGMGTPIGTPPNAIAIGLLADRGVHLSFLAWMAGAFPLMLLMLAIAYALLLAFFPLGGSAFTLDLPAGGPASRRGLVYGTFAVTVLLWLSDAVHHIPSALVALLPVCVFSVAGLFDKEHLRDLAWDILLLIGGGLALGVGIQATGLGESVVRVLALDGLPPLAALAIVGAAMALLATVISHTASANVILPLALTVAAAWPARMGVAAALCASLGMALPISTPPNAIAYGSERLSVRDMARVGALITVLGILLTVLYESAVFRWLPGLFPAVP
ncbi:MAG: DASS family sodium-coupled anion symporter [Candidatus Krumholzibacteriia bacterium]|nr:DASS family sodium-coupled anion symporter [bacterium]MCB9512782.1 DASS family sodium-coupled anion symporter [Candidatus Latescibacterota bacterium]MCB9516868.1 DASS family sodium-coupled anion symporter [Candidatus Latescibacterota bacterium]